MIDSLIYSSNEVLGSYKGGIFNALVWGVAGGIGWVTYEQFKLVGLVHILVASGANVVFLVEAVVSLLAWLIGRKKAILVGLGVGWIYAIAVGFGAPLVRGVLFVTLRYGGVMLGRNFSWSRAMLVVLLICLLGDTNLFFSDSLWLSVAAFCGIASWQGFKIQSFRFSRLKVVQELFKGVWVSAWVLPLIAIKFGKISMLTPVSGGLTFWMIEPLTLIGVLASGIYQIIPMLGKMLYALADVMIECLLWIVSVVASLPGGDISVDLPMFAWVLWYGGLMLVLFSRKVSRI